MVNEEKQNFGTVELTTALYSDGLKSARVAIDDGNSVTFTSSKDDGYSAILFGDETIPVFEQIAIVYLWDFMTDHGGALVLASGEDYGAYQFSNGKVTSMLGEFPIDKYDESSPDTLEAEVLKNATSALDAAIQYMKVGSNDEEEINTNISSVPSDVVNGDSSSTGDVEVSAEQVEELNQNKDATPSGQVLVEENGIVFIYKGVSVKYGTTYYDFYIENNTDKVVMVASRDVSVNNFMGGFDITEEIQPGKKVNTSSSVYSSFMEENGITSVDTIEFLLVAYNSEDWTEPSIVEKAITINP